MGETLTMPAVARTQSPTELMHRAFESGVEAGRLEQDGQIDAGSCVFDIDQVVSVVLTASQEIWAEDVCIMLAALRRIASALPLDVPGAQGPAAIARDALARLGAPPVRRVKA